jgi:hypothetical protein
LNEGQPPRVDAAEESFEAELSDLREPAVRRAPDRHAPLPTLFGARLLPRQRFARALSIAAAILAALAIVVGSVATLRAGVEGLLSGSSPVPTEVLAPGANQFYILTGVPWSTISLDGRPLTHLPAMGADPPLQLARGHHRLAWRADPFQPARCTISVPIQSTDTCPYDRTYVKRAGRSVWAITFFPSLAMLADDQRSALVRVAQSALDTTTSAAMVQPGELYAHLLPDRLFDRATQPLRATLRLQLANDLTAVQSCQFSVTESCTFLGQDCLVFCTVPEQGTPAYWSVLAVVRPLWDFATLDGRTVVRAQADGLALAGTGVLLHVMWDQGAWRVAPNFTGPPLAYLSATYPESFPGVEPACAFVQTNVRAETLPRATDPRYARLDWRYTIGSVRAAGCVGVATPQSNAATAATPVTPLPPAYCLQRFGVLLAANELAHRLWPELPVADAYEQDLARQLAGQLAPASSAGAT